ncbi:hypothetical protein [Plantactinospora sp. CA-290183]|uniref:hypothetical protein n=1 Tax=Plantactinospora sp. CA-290183 TaxID=3240006 RepID=UPI003D8F0B48
MGYEIEPHEVQALMENLLGDVLAEPDDLIAYELLTREQALFDALVSAIRRQRGGRLAKLEEVLRTAAEAQGQPVSVSAIRRTIAELTRLNSRQRVEQLIAAAKA